MRVFLISKYVYSDEWRVLKWIFSLIFDKRTLLILLVRVPLSWVIFDDKTYFRNIAISFLHRVCSALSSNSPEPVEVRITLIESLVRHIAYPPIVTLKCRKIYSSQFSHRLIGMVLGCQICNLGSMGILWEQEKCNVLLFLWTLQT